MNVNKQKPIGKTRALFEEFERLARPLQEFCQAQVGHPNWTCILEPTHIELTEGFMRVPMHVNQEP